MRQISIPIDNRIIKIRILSINKTINGVIDRIRGKVDIIIWQEFYWKVGPVWYTTKSTNQNKIAPK